MGVLNRYIKSFLCVRHIKPRMALLHDTPLSASVLHEYLFRRAQEDIKKNGDSVWIEDASTGEKILRSEIISHSRTVASAFTRVGFSQGDLLMVVASNVIQYWIPVFAAWRCGGWAAMINPFSTAQQLSAVIRDCRPKFVVCDSKRRSTVVEAVRTDNIVQEIIVFGGDDEKDGATPFKKFLEDDGSAFPENVVIDPISSHLYLSYSSGTTGASKGIIHTQGSTTSHFSRIQNVADDDDKTYGHRAVIVFSNNYFHGTGQSISLNSLARGYKLVTFSSFEEELFHKAIQDYKPRIVSGYPHQLPGLTNTKKYDVSSMDVYVTGGSALSAGMILEILEKLPNMTSIRLIYGMTEFGRITYTPIDRKTALSLDKNTCILGYVMQDHLQVRIADLETGDTVDNNHSGEIRIKTKGHPFSGYLNKPEETEKLRDKDGFMSTGDVGFFNETGLLCFVERTKELLKYKMHHVAPLALETVILQHPSVVDAVVTGIPDPVVGELAVAFVVKRPDATVTEEDIIKFVEDRVNDYERLRGGVRFTQSILRNANGKVQRKEMLKTLGL